MRIPLKGYLLGLLLLAVGIAFVLIVSPTNQSNAQDQSVDLRQPQSGIAQTKNVSARSSSAAYSLVLPTVNNAIFSADPSKFYMYTDRNFEGVDSKPWQGGQYGFVRNQKRTGIGVVYTRLHEGMDIRPVKRNSKYEPLDDVFSISDGKVVHVNISASASSYGKYVVVQHDWPEGSFYSLYAHLAWPSVSVGEVVKAGHTLGRLGYTGRGINQERAHVHVELNFLLSHKFETWYGKHFTSKNYHSKYNGFNLTGMNIARFFLENRDNKNLTITDFLSKEEPYFKVKCPTPKGIPDFLKRYPWLIKKGETSAETAPSWDITFARSGVPLSASPSSKQLQYPYVSWVKTVNTNHSYMTQGRLSGSGSKASLSSSGSRYIQLITENL